MQPNIIGNNLASGLALFAISRAYKISWYRSRQPAIKIPILLYGQIDRSVEGLVKQRSPRPSPATYNDRHKGRTDHADAETSNLDKGDRKREEQEVKQHVDETQVDRHGDQERLGAHHLKRPDQGRLEDRSQVGLLLIVGTVQLPQSTAEEDRPPGLGNDHGDTKGDACQDEQQPIGPAPVVGTDIQPSCDQRTQAGTGAVKTRAVEAIRYGM